MGAIKTELTIPGFEAYTHIESCLRVKKSDNDISADFSLHCINIFVKNLLNLVNKEFVICTEQDN